MNTALSDISVLRRRLDEAEAERERLSRHIRHLRAVLRGMESGGPADIEELKIEEVDFSRGVGRVAVEPVRLREVLPAVEPGTPVLSGLGAGLPPGVPSPVAPPPAAALPAIPSVDVGELRTMTPERLDALPFGVVTLDATGRVIGYNDTESRLAGLPRERVIGRNFFGEVAPCARVREFEGRFRDFAEGRSRAGVETFEFVFNFQHGAQRVVILFSPGRWRGEFLMSMIRR